MRQSQGRSSGRVHVPGRATPSPREDSRRQALPTHSERSCPLSGLRAVWSSHRKFQANEGGQCSHSTKGPPRPSVSTDTWGCPQPGPPPSPAAYAGVLSPGLSPPPAGHWGSVNFWENDATFYIPVSHMYAFFGKRSLQFLCPLSIWTFFY